MKRIIANDLAANNTSSDAWKAIWSLFTPYTWHLKKLKKARRAFAQLVGGEENTTFLVDSGRTALTLALRSLQLAESDEVVIQAFSCIVVPNSVLQAGLRPLIADVELNTANIDLGQAEHLISKKTRALVIQHTMGSVCDMESVMRFCKKHNLVLIEDCAHALGAYYSYQGALYPVGSLGDMAMYSFGRDKVISTTIGGVMRINNQKYLSQARELHLQLDRMSYKREFRALWYIIICTFLVRPLYYFFYMGKAALYYSQKLGLVEPVYTSREEGLTRILENPSLYSARFASVLLRQIQHFDAIQSHRQHIYNVYKKVLPEGFPSHNYFRFSIAVPDPEKYSSIIHTLRYEEQVLVGKWYDAVFLPARQADFSTIGYSPSSTPVALQMSSTYILNLPTNRLVTPAKASTIARSVKHVFQNPSSKNG